MSALKSFAKRHHLVYANIDHEQSLDINFQAGSLWHLNQSGREFLAYGVIRNMDVIVAQRQLAMRLPQQSWRKAWFTVLSVPIPEHKVGRLLFLNEHLPRAFLIHARHLYSTWSHEHHPKGWLLTPRASEADSRFHFETLAGLNFSFELTPSELIAVCCPALETDESLEQLLIGTSALRQKLFA